MIDLEDHAIEIQQSKLTVRTKTSLDGVHRVVKLIDLQIHQERHRPEEYLLRSKQQAAEERTKAILEGLHLEKERICMAIEDGLTRWTDLHAVKNSTNTAVSEFIQRKEVMLASMKNKWILRAPEFARRVLDDIQVEDSGEVRKVRENEMVYIVQQAIRSVLALKTIDMPSLNKVISFLISVQYKSILLLYYGTQLLAVICDTEQEFLQGKLGASNWSTLTPLTALITGSFEFIGSAESISDIAMVLLPSTAQALRSLLDLLFAARYCQFMSSGKANQQHNFSAKRKSKDEGVILRGVRDAWEMHRNGILTKLIDCLHLLQHSFHQTPSIGFTISEKSIKGHVALGTLRKVVYNQHTVLANVLQAARMAYMDPLFHNDQADELQREDLLNRTLKLSHSAICQYSVRLGQLGNAMPLSIRDPLYFTVHDNDAIAALDCLTASFSHGHYCQESLAILSEGSHIISHRYHSFFYASSYLKCLIAGCLYYLEHGVRPVTADITRASRQKDPLSVALSASAEKVMGVICCHRNSLTICHKGMLLLRLLATDAFLKRLVIEELVSKPLMRLLDPWVTGDRLNDDDDDEGFEGMDEASLATATTVMTATTVTSIGSVSAMGNMDPVAYMAKFKQSLMHGAYHNFTAAPAEMNLIEVIKYICENHSQSSEVLEQALLLVDHLSNKAHMCKYLLVETGLPLLLQRMLDSRPAELYIAALISICIDDLEV